MAAFNSPGAAGLRAPWRGGNLNDGGNCGLPCANGNNSPGTANWNGVPRHADDMKARKGHKRLIAPAAKTAKIMLYRHRIAGGSELIRPIR